MQLCFLLDFCCAQLWNADLVHLHRSALQCVYVCTSTSLKAVICFFTFLKKTGIDRSIRDYAQGAGMGIGYDGQEFVRPICFFNFFLLYRGLQAVCCREKPHLNEAHWFIRPVIYL